METLTFQPIVPNWVAILIVVLGGSLMLIGPSFVKLSQSRRWTLALLRMGVLSLAMLAVSRPGCIEQIEKSQSAVLLFLIDSTRSMELPHITDDSTRWAAAQKTIRDNQSRFKKLLDNKIDVRFYSFDNRVARLKMVDGVVKLPAAPEGGETDIGSAVYETSLDVRDERLLGVFLLSDGVQNVSDPAIELTQSVETLNDMEVPLFAVQLGLPGDTGQLADLAITNFAEQQIVNVKNDLTARATLVSRGYANQDIKVDLLLVNSAGEETVVKSTVIRPASSYAETNVELVYRPTEPGEFRMKVRANPMPDEKARRNNELDAFLTVNDKGMRVLFLTGDVGWEQSFLRRSLPSTDFIQLDFISIDPRSRATWPETKYESLFKDPTYDVFIFADLDSRALHDPQTYTKSLDALAAAVYGGKGLLMLGGYHSFGAGLYQQTPLANVLPIKMNDNERQNFDADVRRDLHINTPFKLRPTKDSFLTRIGDSESRDTVWKKLPPLVGANRFGVKDNAEILLESDDNVGRPIMVTTNVGGRVLAFAGDSTWRWRMQGFKAEYDQFWRQIILWLAFWDAQNDDSISIVLPQRRFQPKAIVNFEVIVNSINGETVNDARFTAALISPSGERQVITINQVGERYTSELDPDSLTESGLYRIEVTGTRGETPIGTSEREFIVMDRDKEKSNPAANPEQMARLASQTSNYGGRALVPEQVPELLDQFINDPPTKKIAIPIKHRFGDSFVDASLFLVGFVGLLASEWFLRKKWGMV